MSSGEDIYQILNKAYHRAHQNKKYGDVDKDLSTLWKQLKASPEFPSNAKREILKWNQIADKQKNTLKSYWKGFVSRPSKPPEPLGSDEIEVIESQVVEDPQQAAALLDNSKQPKKVHQTPRQDEKRNTIADLRGDVENLSRKVTNNMATVEHIHLLGQKRRELKKTQQSLANLVSSQKRQQKSRRHVTSVLNKRPQLAALLNRKPTKGRQRLEEEQPELLSAIIKIATYGTSASDAGAAEERRRSEVLRTVKTLDDLHHELQDMNFHLSRSALYLRLQPKRPNSIEGKRHVKTVPVRLIRSTNDAHKQHVDTSFAKTSLQYLDEIASVLGKSQVLYISQDDKARVPLGITAANKQAPVLMHLDYRVRLPDHDWVVAERHKLIPSVYAIIDVKSPGTLGVSSSVGYSGPTFIAIRSGKHASSTAYSHAKDLDTLLNLNETYQYTRNGSGDVKPVLMLIVDGGPDENPRYEKVIECAIRHFKKYDLDAMFIATNAPGRSAYNKVERRMAPLSRELAGVILPHETFGSHLDNSGRTIDLDLEKKNFEAAGNALAALWSDVVFDGYNTTAMYVKPEESEVDPFSKMTAEWKTLHVRESHYFLQVVKCDDRSCCLAPRGNYFDIFPRFIPAPLRINPLTLIPEENDENSNGFCTLLLRLRINDRKLKNASGEVPYDVCCPSIQELILSRICKKCGIYFASVKSMKSHIRICKKNPTLDLSVIPAPLTSRRVNRPVRVAAIRQKERMVIWTSRLNDEHCDWFDEEELENVPFEEHIQDDNITETSIPVVNLDQHQASLWEDDTN